MAGLLKSTQIKLRKEAVFCSSNVLKALEPGRVWALVTEHFPDLLTDFCKCVYLISNKTLVMSVFDTVEYLL